MNIINIVTATNDQPLLLKLMMENVLANPIPGMWELQGLAKWSVDNPALTLVVDDNSFSAWVSPADPLKPVVGNVTVTGMVGYGDGKYTAFTTQTVVELSPMTTPTGLMAYPAFPGSVAIRKQAF